MHIERFGKSNKIEGIEKGKCFIFPKIDGSNAQAWLEEGVVQAGQRNGACNEKFNGKGLWKSITQDKNIEIFLNDNPNMRLYGEFLTPHTLKEYNAEAWGKFYVFDVEIEYNKTYRLLSYPEYSNLLDKYNILYIKPLTVIDYPTTTDFARLLEGNKYLLDTTETIGEGIIIKNYDYICRQTKEQLFAKIVRAEFIAEHHNLEYDEKTGTYIEKTVEEKISEEYFTDSFIEKEIDKAIDILFNGEMTKANRKRIPELFDFVFYAFVEEDMSNVIKKYNKPNLAFMHLYNLCRERIKETSFIFKK